jgi:GT2 family glycosyltransferase
LAESTGDYVAFVNNDTSFPPGWASTVLGVFESHPGVGIVAPAVTKAGNSATVRSTPGSSVRVFEPFGHLPSGVVYVMRRNVALTLGGWNEQYQVATGEDLDLLWTVWTNGLEVVLDERVLVEHVSEATRRGRSDMEAIRVRNLHQFLDRWESSEPPPPRLDSVEPAIFGQNLRHAAAAALWLRRLVDARASADSAGAASTAPQPQAMTGRRRRLFRR